MSADETSSLKNWWSTELFGWSGGGSLSAKDVNPSTRVSYRDGFGLQSGWIPEERRVTTDDVKCANASYEADGGDSANLIETDDNGFPVLASWEHYYRIRSLPPSSPVGLLATFPLTIYCAIQRYGAVPLAVAKILQRPVRIHVVGVEKELNFIDLFKELGFLAPESVAIEMTWIIREDMFPKNSKERKLTLQLTTNLRLSVVGGTYGQSLDPDFDLDGAPDMIIGMNAGLFAYASWRHVVSYIHHHKNTVAVFTDYVSPSAVHSCFLPRHFLDLCV